MKTKIATSILGMIFLIGIVSAGTITNLTPSEFETQNVFSGETIYNEFSFDYEDIEGNYDDATLFLKVEIDSENADFPVWKGDFNLSAFMTRNVFGNRKEIIFSCTEEPFLKLKTRNGFETIYFIDDVPNGTFYCYNEDYRLMKKNSQNNFNLEIKTHERIFPGNYNIKVQLMEMEEFRIELNEKWNLISIPYKLWENNSEEIFWDTQSIESVWSYENGEWKAYIPGRGGNLEEIVPGRGYWVRVREKSSIVVVKEDLINPMEFPPSVEVYKGWNLIGHYGIENKTSYCALFSLVNTYRGFPKWSALYGYKNKNFIPLDLDDEMNPGKGYWLEVDVEDSYSASTACYTY